MNRRFDIFILINDCVVEGAIRRSVMNPAGQYESIGHSIYSILSISADQQDQQG